MVKREWILTFGLLLTAVVGLAEETEESYRRGVEAGAIASFDEAGRFLDDVLARDPFHIASIRALELLGDRSSGVIDDATAAFVFEGLAYETRNDWAEAEASYRQALSRAPGYVYTLHNLGTVLLKAGNAAASIRVLEQLLEYRDYPYTYNNLGLAYASLGEPEKACECYRAAIDLDPTYHKAYNNLAASLSVLGREEEAQEVWQKALDINPGYSTAAGNLLYSERRSRTDVDSMGVLTIDVLLTLIETGSWSERSAAAGALLERKDRSTLPRLVELSRHEEAAVRVVASKVLGGLADPRALKTLAGRLSEDPDWPVRFAAAEALGRIGDERAVALLKDALATDAAPQVRRASAWALVAYPTCDTAEALVAAGSDPVAEVRNAAVYALETLGGPEWRRSCPEGSTPGP